MQRHKSPLNQVYTAEELRTNHHLFQQGINPSIRYVQSVIEKIPCHTAKALFNTKPNLLGNCPKLDTPFKFVTVRLPLRVYSNGVNVTSKRRVLANSLPPRLKKDKRLNETKV
jgi:hypothetical protein